MKSVHDLQGRGTYDKYEYTRIDSWLSFEANALSRRRMCFMGPNSSSSRFLVPYTSGSFLDPSIVLFEHLLYVV